MSGGLRRRVFHKRQPWARPTACRGLGSGLGGQTCWTHPTNCLNLSTVPNAPVNPGEPSPASLEDLSFEQALKRLEKIVEDMESEDLPLEKLLSSYQEGSRMATVCQAKLAEAELKVQQLERGAGGELKLKNVSFGSTENV